MFRSGTGMHCLEGTFAEASKPFFHCPYADTDTEEMCDIYVCVFLSTILFLSTPLQSPDLLRLR